MNKNRKTITFDDTLLEASRALMREDRQQFFLLLLEHFLEDKPFPETISDSLRVALAMASPQIRKMQSKFQNGICTKASLCPKNVSESKRSEANRSESKTVMYNNYPSSIYKESSLINLNNNNQPANNDKLINNNLLNNLCNYIIYIKNNQNLSIEQTKDPLKYQRTVEKALNQLATENQQAFLNFSQAFEYITKKETIQIAKQPKTHQQVMAVLFKLLNNPAGIAEICARSEELENTINLRNREGYFTSMLWHASFRICAPNSKPKTIEPNFKQRDYSNEDLNKLFDNLDDIETTNKEPEHENH